MIIIVHRVCSIPKRFRINYFGRKASSIVKLSDKKIKWIIAQKEKGENTTTIAEIQGISVRRVQQILKEYRETDHIPQVGKNLGRPTKPLSYGNKKLIEHTYSDYKFGACYLEKVIEGK